MRYPNDRNVEGTEAFEWHLGNNAEKASDSDVDCETDQEYEGPLCEEEEPLGSTASMMEWLDALEGPSKIVEPPIIEPFPLPPPPLPPPEAGPTQDASSLTHGDVTSPIILSEEDKASLEAARAGLTVVRQAGGDKLSEKLLLTRIDELERKKRQSQNPSAIYLRPQRTVAQA